MTGPWVAAFLVLSAIVLALAVIVLGLLRRFSEALERVEQARGSGNPELGLQPGETVAPFHVVTAEGHEVAVPRHGAVRSVVVFLEPDCAPCITVMGQLRESGWSASAPPLHIVLPDHPDSIPFAADIVGAQIGYQRGRQASAAFHTNVTPVAFVLDGAGQILAAEVPSGVASLRQMADDVTTERLATAKRSV